MTSNEVYDWKNIEIFIVPSDLTCKMAAWNDFAEKNPLLPPLTKQVNVSKQNQKLEFRQGMPRVVFVFQKCSNDVYTKSFDFFVEHAGKILQTLSFNPWKRSFRQIALATFASIFGRPPFSAPIYQNHGIEMYISKSWNRNVQRNARSRKNVMMKRSSENGNLPVKSINPLSTFDFD